MEMRIYGTGRLVADPIYEDPQESIAFARLASDKIRFNRDSGRYDKIGETLFISMRSRNKATAQHMFRYHKGDLVMCSGELRACLDTQGKRSHYIEVHDIMGYPRAAELRERELRGTTRRTELPPMPDDMSEFDGLPTQTEEMPP